MDIQMDELAQDVALYLAAYMNSEFKKLGYNAEITPENIFQAGVVLMDTLLRSQGFLSITMPFIAHSFNVVMDSKPEAQELRAELVASLNRSKGE